MHQIAFSCCEFVRWCRGELTICRFAISDTEGIGVRIIKFDKFVLLMKTFRLKIVLMSIDYNR